MTNLELVIVNAASTVRAQVGKDRMVDKAIELAMTIGVAYSVNDELVEDAIWERV